MLKKILAGLGLSLSLMACLGAPEEGVTVDEGPVATAEQALRPSGRYRTYYSDNTYTVAVGWENRECDWRYDSSDGDFSAYYKEFRYDCPEYNDPFLPSTKCWDCTTATSCTLQPCP
ncbi:hypothetical protein [Polyangium jinanense]|uniref:Lipoprotein n=1 Tax=Polyangium jinanense TaxID=2829994 RepID=A0A9X3X2J4_9BACT|nr:hypothetical protein [Polyangium jinanense]MDC3956146.1 hypothetical protein [Polyangium jinanense]MDC3983019.1 hypothetical protein [Polyangium jinanense]